MRRWKGKQIVVICRSVRLAHGVVHKIRDNVDTIKETAKSGTKVCVCVVRLRPSYPNEPYQKLWMRVFYIVTAFEINNYTVQKCVYNAYIVHTHSKVAYVH
jgi:hypothetical protein